MACFVKRVQRYTEILFPPNVLKIIFQKTQKSTKALIQINQNSTKHTSTTVQEAIKTKIALQSHKTRNNPLNAKSKTREVSILAKVTNTYNRTKLYINATKAGAPCFKIIVGLLVIPP